jgi:ribosome-binding protein aMBF1 (putative translation factor)
MRIKIGKNKIKEYSTFREIRKEWKKDPAFRKASKELELEFALIRAILDARINKGVTQKELADKIDKFCGEVFKDEGEFSYNPKHDSFDEGILTINTITVGGTQ